MKMLAKFKLQTVVKQTPTQEDLTFVAVSETPFDKDGISDDNTFARWTPCGTITMTVTNPDLVGSFEVGTNYYIDFISANNHN